MFASVQIKRSLSKHRREQPHGRKVKAEEEEPIPFLCGKLIVWKLMRIEIVDAFLVVGVLSDIRAFIRASSTIGGPVVWSVTTNYRL